MEKSFKANEFWEDINSNIINEHTLLEKLKDFRRNEINYKTALDRLLEINYRFEIYKIFKNKLLISNQSGGYLKYVKI